MSKIERLNARVAKLLTAAVHEVLEVVRETVSEYQEKTARTQRENESLRRRLRELQDKVKTVGTVTIQPIVLSGSGKRDPIEQEWSPSRRQGTELTPTEEKQEFSEEHKTRQSEVELGAIESDHMAESETECGLLSHDLNAMGSMCAARITDTDLSEFRPHPVENDSSLTAVSVHTVNISTTLSPNTSILSVLPSLASDEIKTEPPEYTASQRHTTQSPIQDCSDSSTNIAQNDTSIEAPRQNNSESYGLLHIHSNYSTFGKRFAFGKNVRSTLDKKHKQYYRKEAEHRCILCGKTFSRIGNLRIHQRCHTGEKPYCCVQCGRCFSQAGDLKKHKRVHTGEKPYYCTQCGKSFSRGENLKRHQKIHIGETLHLHQVWREPHSNEML